MKKLIIPTITDAKAVIQKTFPGFNVSNVANPVPNVVWTATVESEHVKADVFAKFSQRSGWFIDTRD